VSVSLAVDERLANADPDNLAARPRRVALRTIVNCRVRPSSRPALAALRRWWRPIPRQQLVEAIDGMRTDASDDVAQLGLGLEMTSDTMCCALPSLATCLRTVSFI
jgi:hypothetical protein